VEGIHVTFATHRSVVGESRTLVVASALVHTWRRPTFISLGAVGRIFANGLVVSDDGVSDAPDELLWAYR